MLFGSARCCETENFGNLDSDDFYGVRGLDICIKIPHISLTEKSTSSNQKDMINSRVCYYDGYYGPDDRDWLSNELR
jgi:hypothetical protein